MGAVDIKFIKELSKNNSGATCEANISGERCVVKYINIFGTSNEDVKKIKRNLDAQINFAAKLDNEYQKNIALFANSCEYDDKLCYFRPYIAGVPLTDKIRENGCFTPEKAAETILEIARPLAYAHQKGIIHGDLKPENIIISPDNSISIIDWETMKLNREAQNLYADGKTLKPEDLIGTPHYMAPEQCSGEISAQTDVYALGMIYYKMLTGRTPFDHCEIVKIYEAKHRDIDDTVFHDMKIDADATQIISSALKVDRNDRTPSVQEFINQIENYLRMAVSPITVPEISAASANGTVSSVRENEKNDEHKLILIGHPGAGKTVLAAGLYAMNNKNFSIEGANSETIKFMDSVKTILQRQEWPEPTAKSGVKKLDFKVFYNGCQDCITFDEYAGENVLSANYFKDFFNPCPAGAIILLNPSFIVAVDDLTQNKQISSLKNCISYLAGLETPPPVAFVITASDRLETDLQDKAPLFNKYVNEIKNSLRSRKMNFKMFNVSVTGKLEASDNNTKAALNPSNVQTPFVWILKQIRQSKSFSTAKKVFCRIFILLTIIAAVLGGRWTWEWYNNYDLLKQFNRCNVFNREKTSSDDLDEYRKALVDIRRERCSKNHILKDNDTGSRDGKCNSQCVKWTKRYVFKDRQEALNSTILKIDEKIDEVNHRRLKKLYDELKPGKPGFEGNFENLEKDFQGWKPLSHRGDGLLTDFENGEYKELPKLQEKHKFLVVIRKLDEICSKKKDVFDLEGEIKSLPNEKNSWLNAGNDEDKKEFKNLKDKVAAKELLARQSVERVLYGTISSKLEAIIKDEQCTIFASEIGSLKSRLPKESKLEQKEKSTWETNVKQLEKQAYEKIFQRLCSELNRSIDSSKDDTEQLADLVRRYNDFYGKNYNMEETVYNEQKKISFDKLQRRLEKYITTRCSEFHKSQMADKGQCTPDFEDGIIKTLLPLLPDQKVRVDLQTLLNNKLQETREAWLEARRKVINDFKKLCKEKNADEMVDKIKELVMGQKESENPFLKEAEELVLQQIDDEVKMFLYNVRNHTFTEKDFRYMKTLAESTNGGTIIRFCPNLTKAPVVGWLEKYKKWKDENLKFKVRITHVYIRNINLDRPYVKELNLGTHSYKDKPWKYSYTIPETGANLPKYMLPSREEEFSVNGKYKFDGIIYKRNGRDSKDPIKFNGEFYPGIDIDNITINCPESIELKIGIEVDRLPFLRWLKNNPYPEGN